jgi:hypothetical protein
MSSLLIGTETSCYSSLSYRYTLFFIVKITTCTLITYLMHNCFVEEGLQIGEGGEGGRRTKYSWSAAFFSHFFILFI